MDAPAGAKVAADINITSVSTRPDAICAKPCKIRANAVPIFL
jgi:hypothetical protein